MSHDLLTQYLKDVEKAVLSLKHAYVERYDEEFIGVDRLNVRLRIRFQGGFLLEINEAVIVEREKIRHLGYRYHFQDARNNLIFRYDNTPHFPELDNFPHHRHVSNEVVAIARPDLPNVIEEVSLALRKLKTL